MKYEHERILIKTEIIDFAQFQSKTLSEFIDYLTNLHKPYIIEVSIFEPIISIDYYEGGLYAIVVKVYEYESDENYKKRVEKLEYNRKKAEEKIQEKERKTYERLKKKFEKSSGE